MKVLIIEDEAPARVLLKTYLADFPEIEVRGEYDNGYDGLKAINELKPDAVFLDVQMPKLTGFEMLEVLEYHPEIVFTTAYDQFAIQAFEQNAVDYLLKPFSKERFAEAVQKLKIRVEGKAATKEDTDTNESGLQKIRQHLDGSDEVLHRVVIKKSGRIHVIPTGDILYLEAQDDYVMIYTREGRYLKQQTMKYFEKHLDPGLFVRVHRSYIANVSVIDRIEPYEKTNFVLILKDQSKIPVSRNGMQVLRSKLDF